MSQNESITKNSNAEQLVRLRGLVAFLGEKDQFHWWGCSFLGTTGRKFLSITHPRSHVASALMASWEAARRVHDDRIGKGRVSHLFRLPHATEEKIHRYAMTMDPAALLASFTNKEAALAALAQQAKATGDAVEGPHSIGQVKAPLSGATLNKLSGHYLQAFQSGKQVMPYFTAVE